MVPNGTGASDGCTWYTQFFTVSHAKFVPMNCFLLLHHFKPVDASGPRLEDDVIEEKIGSHAPRGRRSRPLVRIARYQPLSSLSFEVSLMGRGLRDKNPFVKTRFSDGLSVAGKTLTLNRTPFTIIAAWPAGYAGRVRGPGIWIPWSAHPVFYDGRDLFHTASG
jgi:hypothetical protein